MNISDHCIYCGRSFDPTRGQGDHVIPASLGEFWGAIPFRGDCIPCNNGFGRLEQQITQCAPEGFLRSLVGHIPSRRGRTLNNRQRGACGAPAPRFAFEFEGHEVLAQQMGAGCRDYRPIDEAVIVDEHGKEQRVRLDVRMSDATIRERLTQLNIERPTAGWFFCDLEMGPRVQAIMESLWPGSGFETKTVCGGDEPVRTRIRSEFWVNDAYFRAIAKMAFHFFLTYGSRGFRGDEECFREIRQFIKEGGDKAFFFDQPRVRFFSDVGGRIGPYVRVPAKWRHELAATEEGGRAVVSVRLFVGPESLPKGHIVTVGSLNTKLLIPKPAWGHHYTYEERSDKYAGTMTPVDLFRRSAH